MDDAFVVEKTGRQLVVIAGRAHGDRHRTLLIAGAQADF